MQSISVAFPESPNYRADTRGIAGSKRSSVRQMRGKLESFLLERDSARRASIMLVVDVGPGEIRRQARAIEGVLPQKRIELIQ